jgi:hypothetical protein
MSWNTFGRHLSFPRPPLCCAECPHNHNGQAFQKKGGEGFSRQHNAQKKTRRNRHISSGKPGIKTGSLNFSPFVAHKYWLRSCACPRRFRAHPTKRGGPHRGRCVYTYTNFNQLQTARNGAKSSINSTKTSPQNWASPPAKSCTPFTSLEPWQVKDIHHGSQG